MSKVLIILNDPPYGTERSYNGLRMAKTLMAKEADVTVFMLADSVHCARRGQKVPEGFYNMELMLNSVARKGHVLMCGTCMDARGLSDDDVIDGAKRSSMAELADITLAAEQVMVF